MAEATQSEADRAWQRRLGHRFQRSEMLRLALTHSSWRGEAGEAAGTAGERDNERLEFLGDAVLALRVSERLMEAYPERREGELTRMRAWLVSARHLAQVAERLDLGAHLRLGRAEEARGGRSKQRLLANGLEAVIAAIHLDGGYRAAARFVDRHVIGAELNEQTAEQINEFGYKSALQEWAHAQGHAVPEYHVVAETGPGHEPQFTVEVRLGGRAAWTATAAGKKQAEQQAARAALIGLGVMGAEAAATPRPAIALD